MNQLIGTMLGHSLAGLLAGSEILSFGQRGQQIWQQTRSGAEGQFEWLLIEQFKVKSLRH